MSKTEVMLIGSRQRVGHQHLAVNIAGNPLRNVSVAKYLGLYIDPHLTWQQHIDHIVSAARARLYHLRRFPVPVFVGSCLFVSVFCVCCFSCMYNQDTTENQQLF